MIILADPVSRFFRRRAARISRRSTSREYGAVLSVAVQKHMYVT